MADTKDDDGGQFFPTQGQMSPDGRIILQEGLDGVSLLDWFAGQVLAGICGDTAGINDSDCSGYPLRAYRIAAAMVAEKRRRELDR